MDRILDSPQVADLAILVEEATRSTEEGVRRFVEPAPGTLQRAVSRRHHIVFGRRGSGKSSLLRKAAADLTIDRRPIAYVDLETFKGHSYPDVLLSVLIETLGEFEKWLRTAAINRSDKTSFWDKLFGTKPTRPAFNRKRAETLANDLQHQIAQLNLQLHSADNVEISKTVTLGHEATDNAQLKAQIDVGPVGIGGQAGTTEKMKASEEIREAFQKSKVDFLHRHILEYQKLFLQISDLSEGDAFLFLDDLYHIQRSDQARVVDYFHRIAKGNKLWLKKGTIRHRTRWYIHGDPPVGLKLGDDADDIDLDVTLEKYLLAKEFLVKILKSFFDDCGPLQVKQLLSNRAIDRLVLASGGVARDFLGIFRRSINVARERQGGKGRTGGRGGKGRNRGTTIGVEDSNTAAGEYESSKREEFRRDTLDDHSELEEEFQKIQGFCLNEAKVNVFLLDKDASGKKVTSIHELVDLRLIHMVRGRVTVSRRAGKIFEAYMLDVSQYTGTRKRRGLEIVEFWRSGADERLRRTTLIYNPGTIATVNTAA